MAIRASIMRAMKTFRIVQFIIAAVLWSIGCVTLLAHTPSFVSIICFTLPGLVLMRHSEAIRPIPIRELWIMVVLMGLIILATFFIPRSALEHLFRSPAIVIPAWVLMMSAMLWRWRTEKRIIDAQRIAGTGPISN
jgi:hypothetical protein